MTSYQDFTPLTGGPTSWQLQRMVAERSCGVCGGYRAPWSGAWFLAAASGPHVPLCADCAGNNGHRKEAT